MSFLDTVKNLLSKNSATVDSAIEKAGDIVDSKTQDKYKGVVDEVQGAAEGAVNQDAKDDSQH